MTHGAEQRVPDLSRSEETCWTLVHGAAGGSESDRDLFVKIYLPIVRAFLSSRWRGSRQGEVDDAVQDTFIDCFREGGALTRADPSRPGRFRTFLFAVVRNIALRYEQKRARERGRLSDADVDNLDVPAGDDPPSKVFDRIWATALLKRAADRQLARAEENDDNAVRRVELLRLRFVQNLPIRDIARGWNVDAALVHRQYARAREEFKSALYEEVAFHNPSSSGDVERECEALLAIFE